MRRFPWSRPEPHNPPEATGAAEERTSDAYDKYGEPVFDYVAHTRNDPAADDVAAVAAQGLTHDVFIALYRAFKDGQPVEPIRVWLFKAASLRLAEDPLVTTGARPRQCVHLKSLQFTFGEIATILDVELTTAAGLFLEGMRGMPARPEAPSERSGLGRTAALSPVLQKFRQYARRSRPAS